jgi:hypothetical protein
VFDIPLSGMFSSAFSEHSSRLACWKPITGNESAIQFDIVHPLRCVEDRCDARDHQ